MSKKKWKWPGRLMMIPPKEILVDRTYQRIQSLPLIERIASNFCWRAFVAVSVIRREGIYYAIDAASRVAAAVKLGIPKVPCVVFPSTGVQFEAMDFVALDNVRNPLRAHELFHAQLQYDPVTKQIHRLMRHHGITYGRHTSASILSPAKWIYALHRQRLETGKSYLDLSFGFIEDCWGQDDAGRNFSCLIVGVPNFLTRLYSVGGTYSQATGVFRRIAIDTIRQKGVALAAYRNRATAYSDAMSILWNQRSANKIPLDKHAKCVKGGSKPESEES